MAQTGQNWLGSGLVRIVFEHDGETWIDSIADRWHGKSVHVSVDDARLQVPGVWVDAGDVRRR